MSNDFVAFSQYLPTFWFLKWRTSVLWVCLVRFVSLRKPRDLIFVWNEEKIVTVTAGSQLCAVCVPKTINE